MRMGDPHSGLVASVVPFIAVALAGMLVAAPLANAQEVEQTEGAATATPTPTAKPKAKPKPSDDSDIEEIVVQAGESDATRDFSVSDSVTGFGAEDLAALGAQTIADIASFTPNLEIVTYGSTSPTFFIRGVGLNDFNSNSTGAVAIYQDDVPRNAPALQLSTLFDVEAVNVLRGPQGTGLARNASAGAIKIYSRKPTGEFGGFMRSDFGNFNFKDFEGAVEAPIVDDMLSTRLAFRATMRDGTMRNRCAGAPPLGDRVPLAGANERQAAGLTLTDAPWSICGEPVGPARGSISSIPIDLPSHVNNLNNWAVRGTMLFQPTLDMTWLINGHGSGRDELSRLGQSIGVNGFTCANGDIDNCGFIGQTGASSRIRGNLGGPQGGGYQAPEIQSLLETLAPCNAGFPGFPNGDCFQEQNRAQDNTAKTLIAQDLAQNLDSEPWVGDFNICSTRYQDASGRCRKDSGKTKNYTYGAFINGDIALPWGLQLTTITGYDAYDRLIDIDLDFSPDTLFHIRTDDEDWQVTQDLKLEGQFGEEGQLRWNVGGWFLREQLNVVVTNDLGNNSIFGVGRRDYTQDLWSTAGFASLEYDFWEDFTLDGGFRYNWEQKKLDYVLETLAGVLSDPQNETWHAPTGNVRLTYRFRDDTHASFKYTRGWKPGTFNATSSPSTGVSTARPETIDAFEFGLRGSWFDGRIGLDTSFFYYSYEDYQLFTAQQFSGGQPEFVILNANDAEVYGVEADLVARPWYGAFINMRFGWLESQFLDFVQLQQVSIPSQGSTITIDRELQNTGNPLLNSPKFKVSLTGEQTIPLGRWGSLTARYDGVWTDTTYYDAAKGRGIPNLENVEFLPEDTIAQPPFWLHNLRVSYQPTGGRFEIAGFVRNIANTSYKTFGFDGSTFNQTTIYFVGDPRTYGGTLIINF